MSVQYFINVRSKQTNERYTSFCLVLQGQKLFLIWSNLKWFSLSNTFRVSVCGLAFSVAYFVFVCVFYTVLWQKRDTSWIGGEGECGFSFRKVHIGHFWKLNCFNALLFFINIYLHCKIHLTLYFGSKICTYFLRASMFSATCIFLFYSFSLCFQYEAVIVSLLSFQGWSLSMKWNSLGFIPWRRENLIYGVLSTPCDST